MPLFGARVFALRIPGAPTGGPFGDNKLVYHDEFLATEIGQTGTQFDGLGHIGIQFGNDGDKIEMRFYNGHTGSEINDAYGLTKLGIEKLKPFFTRGHLFDVEAVKGRIMDAGQEITRRRPARGAPEPEHAGSDIKPGDAVFFNTGWGKLWMKNNDPTTAASRASDWKSRVGRSTRACAGRRRPRAPSRAEPGQEPRLPGARRADYKNGIFIHENLDFTRSSPTGFQFVYVFSPSPIKGATGSHGRPIAVT